MTQQKKQTPTQKIKSWIKHFVTKPNAVFGNLPPCPFAQKAIIEDKVAFVEIPRDADWRQVYRHICQYDSTDKDVLCSICEPDTFTAEQTVSMAEWFNEKQMPRDVVILEDHPKIDERVRHVKLNNGHYTLFLVQSLSKLNKFSKMLESGPYYKNWSTSYLESVKGFRARKT